MSTTKLLTPKQYAFLVNCTPDNIIKKIKCGSISKDLNVVSVNKYGRIYLIEYLISESK